MTANRFHQLWSTGTPLSDAWIEMSREDFNRKKWRALQRSPVNDFDYVDTIELGGWLPQTLEGRLGKLKLIEQLEKSDLFARLFEGGLWAIGYRTKPLREDEPSLVPRDLFHIDAPDDLSALVTNWAKGEVQFGSESFFDVRVVRAPVGGLDSELLHAPKRSGEDIPPLQDKVAFVTQEGSGSSVSPQTLKSQEPDPKPNAKRGRPNKKERVQEMALKLWKTDEAFRAMGNRVDQAREVKARLLGEEFRHADEMAGYKLEVVIRSIGEVLHEAEH